MLTRAEMKQRAKEAMTHAKTHPVIVALVFIVIVGALNTVTKLLLTAMPISFVITIVAFALNSVLTLGITSYYLKAIRHEEAGIETLFSYFNWKQIVKIFSLFFMIQLFTVLWTLLFIIPGIIAAYRYSMAMYILIDNPDKDIMECIAESKQMMIGHKIELFILQISFILWVLLCIITFGIASLYVTPYTCLTFALYYDNLKYISNPQTEYVNE